MKRCMLKCHVFFRVGSVFDGEHQNSCRRSSNVFATSENREPDWGFAFLSVRTLDV